jgi:hypothetical protein
MVTGGGLYARNLELPDFSARYDAPASIAGHRRGVRRFRVYLATQCSVLESKADMRVRGQSSLDDGDALALTFAQPVAPAEVKEKDEDETFGRLQRRQQSGVDAMTPLGGRMVNRWPPWSRLTGCRRIAMALRYL